MILPSWFRRTDRLHLLVRVALLVFFAWLAGRFWHPYYGFTRFIMMDAASKAVTLPELRDAPIFTYEYGYDGHYYAQLAARPAVKDPALAASVDSVSYRARRILLSWMAWAVGGGDPVGAVRAYAWLNLVLWAGLAALLWRLLPCVGWRETLAWGGILFSAGVLHSVRLALTDLLGLLLTTGAVMLAEQKRRGLAAGLLGLGGLARETVVLGAITLLPGKKEPVGDWLKAAAWGVLVALPLALWLVYLGSVLGWSEPGVGNFMMPVTGWAAKWAESWRRWRTEPDHYLALTTLLAHAALTVQALYIMVRPKPAEAWWRLGAVYGVMMLCLGLAVWEGHPGAATRVLLPLGLAFNVLAARARASVFWLIPGNLTVLAGVLVFWQVPASGLTREIAAGRMDGGSYIVQADARWYPIEYHRNKNWAWTATDGGLRLDIFMSRPGPRKVQLALKSFTPRALEIRQDGRVLWSGDLAQKVQWIELPGVVITRGRVDLDLHSPALPVLESPGGRALGFAIYGVKVE